MTFPTLSKTFPLILASASPRRKRLLAQIGLPFRSVPSMVAENLAVEDPSANARLLAEKKARAVLHQSHNNWILGADTVVVLGEDILGKPEDLDDAHAMLVQLSATEHRVITGFCLLDPFSKIAHSEAIMTLVRMKRLTEEEIMAYIATGEPFGKAGSYAIQGIGSFLVEAISGSYTNVVGLPVCALIKALLAAGALETFPLAS